MADEKKSERSKAKNDAPATPETPPTAATIASPVKVTVDGVAVGWQDLSTKPPS